MEVSRLQQRGENEWLIAPQGKMRVPAVICASVALVRAMDDNVYDQATNVAKLPTGPVWRVPWHGSNR